MSANPRPPLLALIREEECIGCAKCLQACPVDAIVGSARKMHTVISEECIGCKLCLPPCPVDCIELLSQPAPVALSPELRKAKASQIKKRYLARQKRLEAQENLEELEARKTYIQQALARVKKQKNKVASP